MADIELVIKIPEDEYRWIMKSDVTVFADAVSKECMLNAIKNGTPLPKDHGKLVDVKQVIMALVYHHFLKDDVTCGDVTKILNMATIIEADKAGE